ncbi:MAG: F0F1 ATP synthase subunit A [Bacteroidetes bacterium]|jgi:F-type H+-transporting ATPase subunit a|nr:F0F1 ATP synthase subunit A [Bacteroidota bacterium]
MKYKNWKKIISFIGLFILFYFLNVGFGENQSNAKEQSNNHKEKTEAQDKHNAAHQHQNAHKNHNGEIIETIEKKEFNPRSFLFGHVKDSYEWHMADWFTVFLPVIVKSKERGWFVFSSKKLHHGHVYKNFKVAEQGELKGSIVEIQENGSYQQPFDISITKNVASLLFSVTLICWLFISMANRYKANPYRSPKGKQSLFEPIILFIRDEMAKSAIGEHKYEKFTPYLLTVFFFIWINNMLGLVPIIPGGANLTGNITVTLALAIFTFIITTINGNRNYWQHIFNTPGVPWILKYPIPLMPVIEVFGMFTKPFVLMVRLFANITAGHIIALGFMSLIFIFGQMNAAIGYSVSVVSILFNLFVFFLELLVAFIQAYVFTFLSALYFGMAVEEHH